MGKKGFTFIELLVAVSVVAILVGIVLLVMNPNQLRAKTRDAKRVNDLKAVQAALEQYFADNESYPQCGGATNWGIANTCLSTALQNYIGAFPADPLTNAHGSDSSPCAISTGQANRYNYISDGSTYTLTALLETSAPAGISQCSDLSNWSSPLNYSCGTPVGICIGFQNPL